jgi:hypothetical protein
LPIGRAAASEPLKRQVAVGQEAPVASKPYAMRLVRVGDSYQGVRFKPATGQTWQIVAGRWDPIAEDEVAPAGDYDVTLIATDKDFTAVRLERVTGATWLLQARKWNRVKEAAGPKAKEPPPAGVLGKGYELRHIRVGDQAHIVRFHAGTGAAAHIQRDTLRPLAEAGPVPPGDFDVTMIATDQNWMAFRLDRTTGATWLLKANTWIQVREPE